MTEKQTNRFNDFTCDFLDDREVRWKKTKMDSIIMAKLQLHGARIKHL